MELKRLLDPPKAVFILTEMATLSFVIYLSFLVCRATGVGGVKPSFLGCVQNSPAFFMYTLFYLFIFSYFGLLAVVHLTDFIMEEDENDTR